MSEINYFEIGKRIRTVRKKMKLTQEEASERCDITSSYYGNIERGNKKMSLETFGKISKGLSISSDYLLFGEGSYKPDDLEEVLEELRRKGDEKQVEKYLIIMKSISKIVDKL